jgi:hypothetical protein
MHDAVSVPNSRVLLEHSREINITVRSISGLKNNGPITESEKNRTVDILSAFKLILAFSPLRCTL